MKLHQHIEFESAGLGNSLANDYLLKKEGVSRLYHFLPELSGLKNAVLARKDYPVNRKALYDVLAEQHAQFPTSELQRENIELLLQENTFTITTGHQLNLLTGPLYFIYKISSAISLASKLNEEMPGYHFVPVYWMNSEDHDFLEINHVFLNNEKMEWKRNQTTFPPAGRISLADIDEVIHLIADKLDGINAELIEFIKFTYTHSSNLAEAHRSLVNRLFSKYGLLILDQDNSSLKSLFVEHMVDDIRENYSFKNVSAVNSILEKAGYQPQVHVRDINYFYLSEESRNRIVYENNRYTTKGNNKEWTAEELINEIKNNPGNFSPNVVTRPLYQEAILPNIAYIGGAAELAYWFQYKSNFDYRNIFYPVILMRDSFLLLPEKKLKKFNELGFSILDLFKPFDDLVNEYLARYHANDFNLSNEIASINKGYEALLNKVKSVDASMDSMVKASMQKSTNELEKIESKIKKAVKLKHEQQILLIKSIYELTHPKSTFQERLINVFNQTLPVDDFVDEIIKHSDCLDSRLKILTH